MENDIANLISNVGFPIAIAVALFYQLMKTNEIIRDFQSTLVKNTSTIEKLTDMIEHSQNTGKVA